MRNNYLSELQRREHDFLAVMDADEELTENSDRIRNYLADLYMPFMGFYHELGRLIASIQSQHNSLEQRHLGLLSEITALERLLAEKEKAWGSAADESALATAMVKRKRVPHDGSNSQSNPMLQELGAEIKRIKRVQLPQKNDEVASIRQRQATLKKIKDQLDFISTRASVCEDNALTFAVDRTTEDNNLFQLLNKLEKFFSEIRGLMHSKERLADLSVLADRLNDLSNNQLTYTQQIKGLSLMMLTYVRNLRQTSIAIFISLVAISVAVCLARQLAVLQSIAVVGWGLTIPYTAASYLLAADSVRTVGTLTAFLLPSLVAGCIYLLSLCTYATDEGMLSLLSVGLSVSFTALVLDIAIKCQQSRDPELRAEPSVINEERARLAEGLERLKSSNPIFWPTGQMLDAAKDLAHLVGEFSQQSDVGVTKVIIEEDEKPSPSVQQFPKEQLLKYARDAINACGQEPIKCKTQQLAVLDAAENYLNSMRLSEDQKAFFDVYDKNGKWLSQHDTRENPLPAMEMVRHMTQHDQALNKYFDLQKQAHGNNSARVVGVPSDAKQAQNPVQSTASKGSVSGWARSFWAGTQVPTDEPRSNSTRVFEITSDDENEEKPFITPGFSGA